MIVGSGARVPNEGALLLNMESSTNRGVMKLQSCFQVAEVTRPLMSVSRVCDQGLECVFGGTRRPCGTTKATTSASSSVGEAYM